MKKLVPIIGLEIHAELNTATKMFCGCRNGYALHDQPNTNTCPVCLGHPGALPTANDQAIAWTITTGLALRSTIAPFTKFDRKNYFYPDLPKGYQISQYDLPLCSDGFLEVNDKKIGIIRIHLEEDTGKLMHAADNSYSLVDLNRAGTPLMELVTEPVITSAADAKAFGQAYQRILRYLGISDADMEKGQMRCEANVSLQEEGRYTVLKDRIQPHDGYKLNPKVEVKNINSFRSLERAIEYEIERMTAAITNGDALTQETRGWDDNTGRTFSQRSKEEAQDYRYFPEPDLPPLRFNNDYVNQLAATLPELPHAKAKRLHLEYGIADKDIEVIIDNKAIASYVEQAISELVAWHDQREPQQWASDKAAVTTSLVNWLVNKFLPLLATANQTIEQSKVSPENLAEFVMLIHRGKLNSAAAQKVLAAMVDTGSDPDQLMASMGLEQIDDPAAVTTMVTAILAANPGPADDYRKGKEAALQFLKGQVMKASKGAVNPAVAEEIIKKLLQQ